MQGDLWVGLNVGGRSVGGGAVVAVPADKQGDR